MEPKVDQLTTAQSERDHDERQAAAKQTEQDRRAGVKADYGAAWTGAMASARAATVAYRSTLQADLDALKGRLREHLTLKPRPTLADKTIGRARFAGRVQAWWETDEQIKAADRAMLAPSLRLPDVSLG